MPKFRYENRTWFWDYREDPFAPGEPKWKGYSDINSIAIDKRLFDYINKITDNPEIIIHPNYAVNVKKCMQFCLSDRSRQRAVKRGKPHQRGSRPSDLRFGSNTFAMKGEFQATSEADIRDKEFWLAE